MSNKIIAIDFDGTCVTHDYVTGQPEIIGKGIGAVFYLKKLTDGGVKLILNTMRYGEHLKSAVKWFEDNNIPLYGVQENPDQKSWTLSTKIYANVYVDDAALGCPLSLSGLSERPYVNWQMAGPMLLRKFDLE